ncbi:MAG TPA: tetratricopeptide repeat protein [Terracidiphilus sp.]|nr:tetratricopeptide repeat protein [Terracidiphilus sp.]
MALQVFGFTAIFTMLACAQTDIAGASAVSGSVRDESGNAVPDASVRLQAQGGARAEERKTDTSGNFGFSGLAAGSYVLSASKGEQHSVEVTITLARRTAIQRVDLTLASPTKAEFDHKGQDAGIEFSDAPNFTVAAVTDWTAAGGHGSDASLRTSEALNRETSRLKPNSTDAQSGDRSGAATEQALRSDIEKSPGDAKKIQALGRLYISEERYSDAVVSLERAHEIDPDDEAIEADLVTALSRNGNLERARDHLAHLLSKGDKPQWHRLAGEVDESSGDPLGAVREFEGAAKADPSEENYFAWGSELLEHRAIWQAKDVFESGVKVYPKSARMLTALGTALFAAALYDQAARRLCEASDLTPTDPKPYLFMGKVELAAPNHLPCIENRLKRFVEMQPANALANYYYAMAYWKEHGRRIDAQTLEYVENYLKKAVNVDHRCSSAYLQLGVLRASRGDYAEAAEFYRKAIDVEPESTEAHYRLGVAYDRLGEKDKATLEFSRHDQLEKQEAALVDRQRREVKQFVVQTNGNMQNSPHQP